jgi:hypothetical protein
MARKQDVVRRYPFHVAGWLVGGGYVVAPQSETFVADDGETYVKDAFLERLRAKEKSNG